MSRFVDPMYTHVTSNRSMSPSDCAKPVPYHRRVTRISGFREQSTGECTEEPLIICHGIQYTTSISQVDTSMKDNIRTLGIQPERFSRDRHWQPIRPPEHDFECQSTSVYLPCYGLNTSQPQQGVPIWLHPRQHSVFSRPSRPIVALRSRARIRERQEGTIHNTDHDS